MSNTFHMPYVPKPQKQYNFTIDNSNSPHLHSRLPKFGSQLVHPAEYYSPLDFVSSSSLNLQQSKPFPLDTTPFTYVEDLTQLNFLASKLRHVEEFAVDLEHNSYRSFQGMTCLMQISTRTEDFVVDTLKLRAHVGDCLREFFADPRKRKVMHGASNDIYWLQRDFGIYVCNLFDTMQASQVLKLERNSLEYLLKYYCDVNANKEYQNSDWRQRPLPELMVKYAREDTHYLLHIQDLMIQKLISKDAKIETDCDDPLSEVFRRSHKVSVQLYKKEIFDRDTSYLNLYGLSGANLDAKQLGVVASLYEWRDKVAREEDESTGYVLPNKLLLEIASKLPKSRQDLLELVGYNKEYVLRDADIIVDIVRYYDSNDFARAKFEDIAVNLKNKIPVTTIAAKIVQQGERLNGGNVAQEMTNRCYYNTYKPQYVGGYPLHFIPLVAVGHPIPITFVTY